MGQGYEDHLVTLEDAIPDVDKVQWNKIDAQLCNAKGLYTDDIQQFYKVVSDIVHVRQHDVDLSTYIGWIASLKEEFLTLMSFTNGAEAQQIQTDKFFMVLTLIGLHPDLESVRYQILASPSVPSLDDVFARLLRLSSTQTLSTDGPSNSSVLASQINSRGGRSGNRGRGQRPYSTSQSITLTGSDYDAYLRYQVAISASVAPDRASDHISCNKHLFSSITTTSALPTVTLANGSQTMAKGPEYGEDDGIRCESQGLYHLTSPSSPAACISTDAPLLIHSHLGHPILSKFQKMVPHFSTLSLLA
ncbi:hypothetical protein CK203_046058 [Vitis vinifera]|uniref:GAG-pre-integrase domain-containing protein n=1 Tax=Vitis vinifera TaxID=29760 RepID=A0A438HP49_VITVI|nr:hypothetical protein CK203_046058 [Vitis vinifera]